MITGLPFVILIAAIMAGGCWFMLSRYRRFAGIGQRLDRLVPSIETAPRDEVRAPQWLRILLRLDPTHASIERNLRSVGVNHGLLLLLGAARLAIAIAAGLFIALFVNRQSGALGLTFLSGLCGFLFVLYGTSNLVGIVIKDIQSKILNEMFFAIDLLVIFLESGQSLDQSLHSLVELSQEAMPRSIGTHRRLVTDLSRGMQHDKAFALWADRLVVEEACDLCSFFSQALTHGVELGPQLRRFADEIMEKRLLNARARVGSKSARLTVIMVLFFLPAILIVLAGPPVVTLLRHLGTMK